MSKEQKQPIQPKYIDAKGVLRFKKNAIIDWLFEDNIDKLFASGVEFSAEDWSQFYQLVGYSIGGFGDLQMVTDEEFYRATDDEPAQLEKAPEPAAWIERRFANGELVLETVKLQKMRDDLRANLALHYDLEIVPLYTSPPDVAELQKQVQALQIELHSLQATKDAQYSGLKTNFDDACKMLRDAQAENNALQAENERLKFDRDVLKASFVKLAVGNIKPKDKS